MTVIHIVLFKFKPGVSDTHKRTFVSELRSLKHLTCVLDQRLFVGGPSITDPIEKSQGYQFALLSFHKDRGALAAYQASKEHERNYRVTSTYLWPFKEDVVRFDFEIEQGDEHLIQGVAKAGLRGLVEDQSHGI
ncbi:hypothetical protein NKR23_g275 [Pleurostoma richardsiae]|uniref:Stress-response A/B barrel domain-containing protein n=1 Tax=Pleurostoma richardsiae TaxID=41990 RepID=A0AA38VY35_9PEZI|nr:hypothetical protein NKR23_g275 [Pleurostoma richardsiae]